MEDPKNQFSKNQIFILFRPVLSSFLARFEFFFDPFEFFMSRTAAPPCKPTHGAHSGHHGGACNNKKPPKKIVKIWSKFVPTPPTAGRHSTGLNCVSENWTRRRGLSNCPKLPRTVRTQAAHIYIYELTPINPLNGS